ncbi:PREDICTED: pumilio homolog 5 [Tarenaya hassleriana]|uniref:pumilio homolog 5 n=1 Tax=Tarenaya hassleriana TaxID=28532 RepID=UPI00053C5B3E|nr:PREDICTED: pumilio homolog 5 [Tarenaya hassleriana]
MTTQSAMRMVESGQTITWPSSREAGVFGSLDMAVEDLGYLMKRHRLREDRAENIPSRSGSAPPSMEGSFAALRNLLKQQEGSSTVLSRDIEKYDSEEEIRSDPAYVAYYLSNINLNPRLPPPLISRENQHLVRRFGGLGDDSSPSSIDNNVGIGKRPLLSSRSALSTHTEVPEDEASGEQSYISSSGRHKSLVDLIQEDFPRTPSPVFNQPHPGKNHPTAEELIDCDIHAIPSDISSENTARLPESDIGSVNMMRETDSLPLYATVDPFTGISSSHSVDGTRNSPNPQKERSKAIGTTRDDLSAYSVSPSNDSRMRKNQEEQQSHGRRLSLQYPSSSHQLQASAPQLTYGFTENTLQNLSKLSKPEIHSNFTSPRLTTPLYTSTAAYMNSPFYQNFQPSGMYIPQYNYSGYPPGTGLLPPYMTGYPSHGATVPMPYDVSSSSSYNARQPGGSTGQNIPSLVDPYQMQYFQPALGGDAYASSFQNIDSFGQKDQASGFMAANQDLHSPMNMNLGLQSPRHMGMGGSNYFAVQPGVRVTPQYLGSQLSGSPVLPSSPVGGMALLGRRGEARYHQGPSRNIRIYPEWQGHRGGGSSNIDELKRHSFLDELKSPNARKFELSDIAGRIFEFSVDQHGSRFIQQKLEHCTDEEKASVFSEVLPHASKLMTDVFGNYVIQKFLEYGSPEQRQELVNQLAGQIVSLSMQMYGCRVIQKALEVIDLDQKTELISELDGHVMGCVRDQNGNHVIQKCIETIPSNRIGFIIAAFRGQVSTLSTHPYGCRVIQRILEHCSDDEETRCIVDEILESAYVLAHDQYGNYVTQHVLERGRPDERSEIIKKLTGNVVQMSQHKYASNVVEKCLEYADNAEREVLIEEIMGKSEEDNHLLAMMKDQFANYVVQKVLEISKDGQREVLVQRVKVHLESLRKYTYGKHIVVRFERLFGEEGESSDQV